MDLLSSAYPSLDSHCVVCNTEVSDSETHRVSDEHLDNYRKYKKLYPANIAGKSLGAFSCLWCNKTLTCTEILEAHLQGKEHSKRCANSGIPLYGQPGHFEHVAEYVRLYGNDPYARLVHWPPTIVDSGMFWTCTECGTKFHTQKAVNDHLDLGHTVRPLIAVPKSATKYTQQVHEGQPEKFVYPQLDDALPFITTGECSLCNSKFSTSTKIHEQELEHLINWATLNHDEHTISSHSSVTVNN